MRLLPIIAASVAMLSVPVLAQAATTTKHPVKHAAAKANPALGGQKPIDVGPNTPEANRAYQGGGVILQGAPGAPAPTPAPTPAGQTPANSVPR